MRAKCLVMDHDDTVVNSTATVHFPCFLEYLKTYRPEAKYTLEEYISKNFHPGIVSLFRDELGMDDAQMDNEQIFWNAYVQNHVPQAYEGMKELLWHQKEQGGLVCVVSHSFEQNILRDFAQNGLPEPDLVFGWNCPPHQRKPSTYPLEVIMKTYGLTPEELLVVDDLKPGFDMAKAAGVPFAAALWAYDIPEIQNFFRENCPNVFETVDALADWLK